MKKSNGINLRIDDEDVVRARLTLRTWALVLLCKIVLGFLTYLKLEQLFHELMNQYQACLYLFKCISHVVPKSWNSKMLSFLTRRLHSPAAWKALLFVFFLFIKRFLGLHTFVGEGWLFCGKVWEGVIHSQVVHPSASYRVMGAIIINLAIVI